MTTTTNPPRSPLTPGKPAESADGPRRGPIGRIIADSLATGLLGAVLCTLVVFAGATEHVRPHQPRRSRRGLLPRIRRGRRGRRAHRHHGPPEDAVHPHHQQRAHAHALKALRRHRQARRPGLREVDARYLREGWPRGGTSDDTALTLLVAHHLADRDGDGDPAAFLADLAGQEPIIRGLGPTTTAAIERFRRGEEAADSAGRATNGAAMRALPIGWVLPHDQAERRRQVTIAMSRATHADPAALVAACVMATCASWALEGAGPSMLLEAAAEEAREAAQAVATEARLAEMRPALSVRRGWQTPDAHHADQVDLPRRDSGLGARRRPRDDRLPPASASAVRLYLLLR